MGEIINFKQLHKKEKLRTNMTYFQKMTAQEFAHWIDKNTNNPCDFCVQNHTDMCESIRECQYFIKEWLESAKI